MKKYSTSEINLGRGHIRMHLYLDLLKRIEQKGVGLTSSYAVINSKSKYFIVDKKYESLCNLLMKKYEKCLIGKNKNYKIRYDCAIMALIIFCLLNKEKLENVIAQNDYIEENIETEEVEILIEEEQKNPEELTETLVEETNNLTETYNQTLDKMIEEQMMYETYLEEYSGYFHLDSEKVKELAKLTTNNYKDFASIIGNSNYDYTNPEACSMLFVYHLNRNELTIDLSEFNLTTNDLLTTNEIETTPHDNLDELYLKNGERYSEFYGKICDFFAINSKELALAASFIEIGKTGSYSSNNRNNVRGLTNHSGELMTSPTLEAGIIEACGNWKNGYNDYNIDSILELTCYHITGSKTLPTIDENDPDDPNKVLYEKIMNWKESVTSFYYEICENYDFYFSSNNQKVYVMDLTQTK